MERCNLSTQQSGKEQPRDIPKWITIAVRKVKNKKIKKKQQGDKRQRKQKGRRASEPPHNSVCDIQLEGNPRLKQ